MGDRANFETLHERGWNPDEYIRACREYDGDYTPITLSHPLNWLTEEEAENEDTVNAVMKEVDRRGFHVPVGRRV